MNKYILPVRTSKIISNSENELRLKILRKLRRKCLKEGDFLQSQKIIKEIKDIALNTTTEKLDIRA